MQCWRAPRDRLRPLPRNWVIGPALRRRLASADQNGQVDELSSTSENSASHLGRLQCVTAKTIGSTRPIDQRAKPCGVWARAAWPARDWDRAGGIAQQSVSANRRLSWRANPAGCPGMVPPERLHRRQPGGGRIYFSDAMAGAEDRHSNMPRLYASLARS